MRQGEGRDCERDENPGCRFLVVEDGEHAEEPDLHPREVIQPIVKQLLLVHPMLPHPVDFVGGKRLAGERDMRRIVRHCYCTIWRSDMKIVRIQPIGRPLGRARNREPRDFSPVETTGRAS